MSTVNARVGNAAADPQQSELETRYAKLCKDPKAIVFCPWCNKINRAPQEGEPPAPACCPMFAEGVALIGRTQFESVRKQFLLVRAGRHMGIVCPYCGVRNKKPAEHQHPAEWPRPMVSPFCCDLMSDAATAIVERLTLERLIEDKKRIEDGVSRGTVPALKN